MLSWKCCPVALLELCVPPDEEEEVARPMVGGLTLPTLEPPPPRSSSPSPTAELMRGAGTTPILAHMPEPGFGDLDASEDTWRSEPFPPPPVAPSGAHVASAAPAGWLGFDRGRPQELAPVPRPAMAQPVMKQPAMGQQRQPGQSPQLAMAQPAMAKPPPPAKPASALDDLNFAIQQAMGGTPSPAHSAVPSGGARIALRFPLGWHGSLGSVLLGWRHC